MCHPLGNFSDDYNQLKALGDKDKVPKLSIRQPMSFSPWQKHSDLLIDWGQTVFSTTFQSYNGDQFTNPGISWFFSNQYSSQQCFQATVSFSI